MGQIVIKEEDEDEALSLYLARQEGREHDLLQGPPPLPADLLKRHSPPTYIERIALALAFILIVPVVLGAAWVVASLLLSLERLT